MSLRDDAEMRLMLSSGSCTHRISSGTAPASTTAWASSAVGEIISNDDGGVHTRVVARNVSESPSRSLLYTWVKLFEAHNERIQRTGINDSLPEHEQWWFDA
jgi:hypothetical protein